MMIDPESLDIRQDTSQEKFLFNMKGGAEAYLQYKLHTDNQPTVVEFVKTHIPETLKDIGLGEHLAKKGMEFAEKNGYRIKLTCPVFSTYFKQHPEYEHLEKK